VSRARKPTVIVCAGGGGVGKTTTSAALALALARTRSQSARTLVVTVDPARRLADAMGVPIGSEVRAVSMPGIPQDRLFALMPEPRGAVRTFVDFLFDGEPEARARLLENSLFTILEDAVAGVHELLSVLLVARAAREHAFAHVVVDTAPSRHALDLVSTPGRFAALLEGRALAWLASLAQRASPGGAPSSGGGALAWGRRRVEDALARLLGARFITDLTQLFVDLGIVRERLASLAREAEEMLLGEGTRFLLVAAPTGAAKSDLLHLAKRLEKLGRLPAGLILNRADQGRLPWADVLTRSSESTPAIRRAVSELEIEQQARTAAADSMAAEIAKKLPGPPLLRLPAIASQSPVEIVQRLSTELEAYLPRLFD
jgi:anion-transporting  ArsA/GET3 family ATPase